MHLKPNDCGPHLPLWCMLPTLWFYLPRQQHRTFCLPPRILHLYSVIPSVMDVYTHVLPVAPNVIFGYTHPTHPYTHATCHSCGLWFLHLSLLLSFTFSFCTHTHTPHTAVCDFSGSHLWTFTCLLLSTVAATHLTSLVCSVISPVGKFLLPILPPFSATALNTRFTTRHARIVAAGCRTASYVGILVCLFAAGWTDVTFLA